MLLMMRLHKTSILLLCLSFSVFDGIRISRILFQKYNNPVMICKIFARLSELLPAEISSGLSHALSVFMRGNLIGLLKFLDKIACTVKSHIHGDLRHRCV